MQERRLTGFSTLEINFCASSAFLQTRPKDHPLLATGLVRFIAHSRAARNFVARVRKIHFNKRQREIRWHSLEPLQRRSLHARLVGYVFSRGP